MNSVPILRCDCCALAIDLAQVDDCPRCGYPIRQDKEEHFLQSSIHDLQRVAAYGGAYVSIAQLIERYQKRLAYLHQCKTAIEPVPRQSSPFDAAHITIPVSQATAIPVERTVQASEARIGALDVAATPVFPPASPALSVQTTQRPVFSLKTFFGDQSINIVASLGAFLILVGSLSFVSTTPNLLLSFLIMLAVHAFFGIIGAATYRFRSFRVVAIIYTTIFALQVPLIGFAGYRLLAGNIITLSAPTLVAISSIYAAVVYSVLAVYQRFLPFGYLASVALVVADLAASSASHLEYWWWPSVLMLLAFPALISVLPVSVPNKAMPGTLSILRDPLRFLMFFCVLICALGIIFVTPTSLGYDVLHLSRQDIRFSIVCMLGLLLCWLCLYSWRSQLSKWMLIVPYLVLACLLSCLYAFKSSPSGYAIAFTLLALFYAAFNSYAAQWLNHFHNLGKHIEILALVLVAFVPFIVEPILPVVLLTRSFHTSGFKFSTTSEVVIAIITVFAGFLLTVAIALSHTGLRRQPAVEQTRWRWLLLLSGGLLFWAYGVFILACNGEPVWYMLGLTLVLSATSVAVRRWVGAAWANPLDILALAGCVQTIISGLGQDRAHIIGLLLFFAILSYGVVLYQRRRHWLFLPLVFAVLALPFMLVFHLVLLVCSVSLPLAAIALRHFVTGKWNELPTKPRVALAGSWEWPLLIVGLIYEIVFSWSDASVSTSTVSVLELASFSLIWYVTAMSLRVRWCFVANVGFAVAALLLPSNPFWILAWLAPVIAILAWDISRFVERDWALPLYVIALFAEVMAGITGYHQGQLSNVVWAMLAFALLLYLIGVAEKYVITGRLLIWAMPCFVTWSVYYSAGPLGDLYRAPIVVLISAAIGVGIGCLRTSGFVSSETMQSKRFLHLALPWYAAASASAILTGLPGTLTRSVNIPFFAAVPLALFVYALIAYGVVWFEKRPAWLWVSTAFAVWSALLTLSTSSCLTSLSQVAYVACSTQVQTTAYCLMAIGLLSGLCGLLADHFVRRGAIKFTWSWPWYLTSLVAMGLTVYWCFVEGAFLPRGVEPGMLCVLIVLTVVIMLVTRTPEWLVICAGLATWTIARVEWPFLWQEMSMYSLLCAVIFASQLVWRVLPPTASMISPARLHSLLGIIGQVLVVLTIILQGGLSTEAGMLGQSGVGALLVLALLILWYGVLHRPQRIIYHWCLYGTGLLFALAVSWELSVFHQTDISLLTLAPATYLIVIAPFLSRDEALPDHHILGQLCSIIGAMLLLLPMLWMSFSQENLKPVLILAGESLALLLVGICVHVRFFVLSGIGLVIVSAIHMLFLPSIGIPTFLALILVGVILLAVATALMLARPHLARLWTEME